MGNLDKVISFLLFLGALLPLFWGFYMIKLDSKLMINRIFLLLNLALSSWSFGLAMANLQSNVEGALFWRRFAAVGWTSIFSLILHFFLLITNDKNKSKLCKYLPLLHIPSLIMMFIFALSNEMAVMQYDLIKVSFGWTNRIVNNHWDYLYYLYYAIYLISSVIVVWKWRGRLQEKRRIRQANLILFAIFFSTFFGTLTDFVIASYSSHSFPQLAPLFVLLPVYAMYYSGRYYDVLNLGPTKKEEKILSTKQQMDVFNQLSTWFFISGLLTFAFRFFSSQSSTTRDLKNSLLQSGAFLSLGIIMLLVQRIKEEWLREKLTLVVLVVSIPIVTFQFLNSSTITVWAYSILIIIASLLFDKRFLLLSATIVSIITQSLFWILRGRTYVMAGGYDFILRIIFLVVAFVLGSYVNKVYIAKVRENQEQIAFQEMILAVTFDFLSFNEENSDEKIQMLLKKAGIFFNVDRMYLYKINHTNNTMIYSNEWCKPGIKAEISTMTEVPLAIFPWWINQLNQNNLIEIEDVNAMPKEAKAEQEELQRQSVKSLIAVPVMENKKIYAFIGVDSVTEHNSWSAKEIKLLHILANILANVLTPIQIDKQTEFMAYNDALTGLPNRYLFLDRVNQAIRLSKRTGNVFAVIFIDLDGFKSINDSLGHEGGDSLLKQVAEKLEGVVRESDTVARFGGDEFLIMVNNITDLNAIDQIANKIIHVFSKEFVVSNQEFVVTASIGISTYPADGENPESLVRNADVAMYHAKNKGKNQYVLCTQEMKDELSINKELSADLNLALERDEFIIHYQPQVDLLTNKIIGVEALIRWIHPTKGLISPGIFIPLAEKNNLINGIGEWVLRNACIQNKKWQDMGLPHVKVAVNLSAGQIINMSFTNRIETIIKETGLDPKYIELEVTESIAIEGADDVLGILSKIKDTGVSIAIDDFGTEYSSLSRLKLLPVDQIKIDMQFVQAIETSVKDQAIIITIIDLARSLDLTVVAEGVETAEQLAFLKQEKCDSAQGYYYYKPMSAEEIEKIL